MKRFALVLILAAFAANAADSTSVNPAFTEHRARIEKAIDARDYDAWKAEREYWGAKGQAGQKVTKENFETFARMHEAMKAGRTDEAATLRKQLGLGAGNGGMGAGKGMGQGNCAKHGQGKGMGQGGGHGQSGMNGAGCMRNQ